MGVLSFLKRTVVGAIGGAAAGCFGGPGGIAIGAITGAVMGGLSAVLPFNGGGEGFASGAILGGVAGAGISRLATEGSLIGRFLPGPLKGLSLALIGGSALLGGLFGASYGSQKKMMNQLFGGNPYLGYNGLEGSGSYNPYSTMLLFGGMPSYPYGSYSRTPFFAGGSPFDMGCSNTTLMPQLYLNGGIPY